MVQQRKSRLVPAPHTKRSAPEGTLLTCTTLLDVVANTELLDEGTILEDVVLLDIGEKTTATADEHEQTTTGVEVLLAALHVLGELLDALGEDRNLNLGVTSVDGGVAELSGELGLALLGNSHVSPFIYGFAIKASIRPGLGSRR